MPQPESCSSDWRMSGLPACSSSCSMEIGSAETHPRIRHMRQVYGGRETLTGALLGPELPRRRYERAEANLVGAPAQAVRTRAAGWGRAQPPAGAPRSGDRMAEGGGCAHGRLDDDHAPQP